MKMRSARKRPIVILASSTPYSQPCMVKMPLSACIMCITHSGDFMNHENVDVIMILVPSTVVQGPDELYANALLTRPLRAETYMNQLCPISMSKPGWYLIDAQISV